MHADGTMELGGRRMDIQRKAMVESSPGPPRLALSVVVFGVFGFNGCWSTDQLRVSGFLSEDVFVSGVGKLIEMGGSYSCWPARASTERCEGGG
jgi:hypothetical protein